MPIPCIAGAGSRLYVSEGGGGGNWWDSGQLSAGRYEDEDTPLVILFPADDAGTDSTYFHRLAYYDGSNSVQYTVFPVVGGGAENIMCTLVSGPPGATVPEPFYRGVDANGDSLPWGWVEWTPDQSYSVGSPATFVYRVRDQNGSEVTRTWTVITSSSTNDFLFINNSTGSDSNTGAIGSPFLSISKIVGAATSTTTFPGRHVYLRGTGSSYTMPSQTGSPTGTVSLDSARNPIVIKSFPGEDVVINQSGSQWRKANVDGGGFGGSPGHPLIMNGSSATAAETHTVWVFEGDDYHMEWVGFTNPTSRVAGDETNSTSIHTNSQATNRQRFTMTECYETGRDDAGANNNAVLFSMFSCENSGAQFCRGSATPDEDFTTGPNWKDDTHYIYNRHCTGSIVSADLVGSGQAFNAMCQSSGSNIFFVACKTMGGYMGWNLQSGNTGAIYATRCTVYSSTYQENQAIRAIAGTGPFTSKANALVSRTGNVSASVTNTKAEVTYQWNGDGSPGATATPISPTTGLLRNITSGTQWRTLYMGTADSRGHEYAVP